MSYLGTANPDYSAVDADGNRVIVDKAVQSFEEQTDVNRILARQFVRGAASHVDRFEAQYRDYANYDFHAEANKLATGMRIWEHAPLTIKEEFVTPGRFFEFVNDPDNRDRVAEVLPDLALPGIQLPTVVRTPTNPGVDAPREAASAPSNSESGQEGDTPPVKENASQDG